MPYEGTECMCPYTALLRGLRIPACPHHWNVVPAECGCGRCRLLVKHEKKKLAERETV